MSKDLINLYEENSSCPLPPMNRKLFYEGVAQGKFKDNFVEVVNIFLFKLNGQLAIQKRAITKNHNPGLLDKSIGGHVDFGNTPKLTVMAETIQELGTAAYVSNDKYEFASMVEMLRDHLNTVSLALHIDTIDVRLKKIINNESVYVGNRSHLYFGLYNGPIDFKDNETSGINYYSLDNLRTETKKNPYLFTDDVHHYLDRYLNRLFAFRKQWIMGF